MSLLWGAPTPTAREELGCVSLPQGHRTALATRSAREDAAWSTCMAGNAWLLFHNMLPQKRVDFALGNVPESAVCGWLP